jgi:hypothetical protein
MKAARGWAAVKPGVFPSPAAVGRTAGRGQPALFFFWNP